MSLDAVSLDLRPAFDVPSHLAVPVQRRIATLSADVAAEIRVAPINPELADTAAFCEAYGVAPEASANCIVVAGKRGDVVSYAACVVLATTRADVNGAVRKLLGARKVSFAPMDEAMALTEMEYGGITPIGLPESWRVLVDSRVAEIPEAIIGAGIRGAKICLPGSVLAGLPGVEVVEGLARVIE